MVDPRDPDLRERHRAGYQAEFGELFEEQGQVVAGAILASTNADEVYDVPRWKADMYDRLRIRHGLTARAFARHAADLLDGDLDASRMDEYLDIVTELDADNLAGAVRDRLADALDGNDPQTAVAALFDQLASTDAERYAESAATQMENFGAHEGAAQSGASTKTWQVNSGNPRSTHAAMAGETVAVASTFSNGMRWPGDMAAAGAAEIANCQCSVTYTPGV